MTRPVRLKIRPREEIQKHDWYIYDERDGLAPVVQADSLLQEGAQGSLLPTSGGYMYDYHILIGFPRVVEQTLILSGK